MSMNRKNNWNSYGFALISKYRRIILRSLLESPKTPTQIANEHYCNVSHISRALRELKEKGLVKCLNPERRKGRVYALTDKGLRIAKRLKTTSGKSQE